MANGFLKRGMSYLGLIDDGYDDGGQAIPDDHLDSPRTADELGDEDGLVPTRSVQPVNPAEGERSSNVTLIAPRVVRARSTELSPHVQAVAPTEFADARQIADYVMASQPVIVNLQTASRELKRRMIDFCSGVTYALGGGMERVAKSVFLFTPSDVELSAVERERALLGPDEFSAMPDAQAL
jgi:FtsZ-interacting cell division protein YlmF